jgi:hypothetical protein
LLAQNHITYVPIHQVRDERMLTFVVVVFVREYSVEVVGVGPAICEIQTIETKSWPNNNLPTHHSGHNRPTICEIQTIDAQ